MFWGDFLENFTGNFTSWDIFIDIFLSDSIIFGLLWDFSPRKVLLVCLYRNRTNLLHT